RHNRPSPQFSPRFPTVRCLPTRRICRIRVTSADGSRYPRSRGPVSAVPLPLLVNAIETMSSAHYDCIVIGTGPAGQKGAIQAAKLGKKVAIIEKNAVLGGAQINTGTIPSKALREAVLHLTGAQQQGLFGSNYTVKRNIPIADLVAVSHTVMRHEWDLIRNQFDRNGVELIWGTARFAGPNEVIVAHEDRQEHLTADRFLIAVGTRPARPADIPF